jgi:hypothetical protein
VKPITNTRRNTVVRNNQTGLARPQKTKAPEENLQGLVVQLVLLTGIELVTY